MSTEEITMWVVFNKDKGNAFKNMTYEQIYAEISEGIANNTILIDTDEIGYITGLIILEPRLHIKELIAIKTSSFKKLMDLTRQVFPFARIYQAWRRNKLTVYKTPNYMIDKVMNLKEVSNGKPV